MVEDDKLRFFCGLLFSSEQDKYDRYKEWDSTQEPRFKRKDIHCLKSGWVMGKGVPVLAAATDLVTSGVSGTLERSDPFPLSGVGAPGVVAQEVSFF